jgi:hypothetical protein
MTELTKSEIAKSDCIVVENVLFLRREIEPGATVKSIVPLLTIIEIQQGLDIKRVRQMERAQNYLSEAINWN